MQGCCRDLDNFWVVASNMRDLCKVVVDHPLSKDRCRGIFDPGRVIPGGVGDFELFAISPKRGSSLGIVGTNFLCLFFNA